MIAHFGPGEAVGRVVAAVPGCLRALTSAGGGISAFAVPVRFANVASAPSRARPNCSALTCVPS